MALLRLCAASTSCGNRAWALKPSRFGHAAIERLEQGDPFGQENVILIVGETQALDQQPDRRCFGSSKPAVLQIEIVDDASDAAERNTVEVLVESAHLRLGPSQLHFDAARDVLGCAAQIGFLVAEALLEHAQVTAQALEREQWVVDLGDLSGDATREPFAYTEPQGEEVVVGIQ